jgi:nucleoside-diphosphate-sugar epimerase
MRVFIAGATGAIGKRLVPQLVARGHDVTATSRSARHEDQLSALGGEHVMVDGLDGVAVGEAIARAEPDAVVHQMTALAGKPDLKHFDRWFATTNELRTRGTEHLLSAAQAAGVSKFVAQSYTGWANARTGGPIKTEADELDPNPAKNQRESLAAIRFLERAVTQAPLDGIVLRYGSFYGPGEMDGLVELIRRRRLPIVGDGSGVWSWIHLDDAAAATVAALESDRPGIYNVVDDDPARVSDWLPYLAEIIGAKPPLRIPVWLGRLAAGEVVVRTMTEIRGASNEKAKNELDWKPVWSSWREGFSQSLSEEAHSRSRPVKS